MKANDFLARFNRAVQDGNWPEVKLLGESAVADRQYSPEILYNLGLAYFKTDDAPMAVSVLLAVPAGSQDAQHRLLLNEALRRSGHDQGELELGAHGLTGIMAKSVSNLNVQGYYGLGAAAIAVGGICLLVLMNARRQRVRTKRSQSVRIVTRAVGILSALVTVYALVMISISGLFGGHWGAVIAPESAPIRMAASQDSEVTKALKPGQPVMVLGDPSQPWVKVLESSGGSGWMSAQDLRCVHGRF